jgi:hypothetical protein
MGLIGLIGEAAAPTPAQFSAFWFVLAFMATVAANIAAVIAVARKQKREVTFGFEPASKVEFTKYVDQNQREHENLFSKIGGVERGAMARLDQRFETIQSKAEEGREKLHDRINEILGEVRELRGEVRKGRREH